jgi:hypothetical protein
LNGLSIPMRRTKTYVEWGGRVPVKAKVATFAEVPSVKKAPPGVREYVFGFALWSESKSEEDTHSAGSFVFESRENDDVRNTVVVPIS